MTAATRSPTEPFASPGRRRQARLAPHLLCALGWLILASPEAAAEQCWISASPHIAFGPVGSGGASSSGTLDFSCNNWSGAPITYRVCLFMNPNQPDGVAPRRMVLWWPLTYLQYDLYADPAYTQVIGSDSSGHPVHSTVFQMDGNGEANGLLHLYARMPPGQAAAAGHYENQITSLLRYAYRTDGTAPTPEACAAGPSSTNYSTVTAGYINACHIATATDLDFGTVAGLSSHRDQTSTIQLHCPTGTVWRVGLNNGSHASGQTRRMAGPGGVHLTYELYRDGARSQRWGAAIGTDTSDGVGTDGLQTLTVYGRVPAQPTPAAGTYTDTIIITLTY